MTDVVRHLATEVRRSRETVPSNRRLNRQDLGLSCLRVYSYDSLDALEACRRPNTLL